MSSDEAFGMDEFFEMRDLTRSFDDRIGLLSAWPDECLEALYDWATMFVEHIRCSLHDPVCGTERMTSRFFNYCFYKDLSSGASVLRENEDGNLIVTFNPTINFWVPEVNEEPNPADMEKIIYKFERLFFQFERFSTNELSTRAWNRTASWSNSLANEIFVVRNNPSEAKRIATAIISGNASVSCKNGTPTVRIYGEE